MQVTISIEPYLAFGKVKITQYLEKIVEIRNTLKMDVALHFDYFKHDPEVFSLVQSYSKHISVDLHLMQEPAPSVEGFRSVSVDLMGPPADLPRIKKCQRGYVLDLGCKISGHEKTIQSASYIIIMTVKCGKSGQAFQSAALDLIPQVRLLNPKAVIIVDGGINENNILTLRSAGVDMVVVGSYAKKCYENGTLEVGVNRLLHN